MTFKLIFKLSATASQKSGMYYIYSCNKKSTIVACSYGMIWEIWLFMMDMLHLHSELMLA